MSYLMNLLGMCNFSSTSLAALIAVVSIFLALRVRSARGRAHLLPGPKPLPVIGNLLDIPRSEEWVTWQKYIQRYGDLVSLTTLGNSYLLLGSQEAINDLLEKRAHFNDRPHLNMLGDLMKLDWMLPIVPYGNSWRRSRKIMHSQLHAKAAEVYQPIQIRGARRFVGDLLAAEPNRPINKLSEAARAILPRMVRYNFAHTAVHMIYGIDVRDRAMEARYVEPPESLLHYFSQALSAGQFLVDFIPILKHVPSWVPGAYFQRFAQKAAHLGEETRDNPIAFMKAQMASGTLPEAMAAEMLRDFPNEEQLVKDAAGTMYLGGSDTTVAAVTSYFLAAVIYPDVQKYAQEELDRVVGRSRFPDFADKSELPYLEAVMRECLRWLPVMPVATAHVSMQDDEYRGYFIPKGTIALAFQWGLLHDKEMYPDPSVFSPERHLTRLADGSWKLREDVVDPRKFVFGFGRRVCPGVHIAEQSLFAVLTTVMHTLDVLRVKDLNGQEIIPEARMSSGMLCHPLPFPYALRARTDSQHLVDMCSVVAGGY